MRTHHRLSIVAIATVASLATAAVMAVPADAGHDTIDTLRAENRRLRHQLAEYQEAYQILLDGLDTIENEAHGIRDRRAHRRIHRAIERVRDDARLDRDHDHDHDHDDDDGRRTLSQRELKAVIDKIDAALYADDQLDLVRSVAKTSYFTVDQVVAIMKACDWEDTRIEAAVLMYPRIVDLENNYRIYDGLTYSSSRTTLRKRLGG